MVGVGVDVVDVERFRRALERTPSMHTRLFVEVERRDLADRVDPVPGLAVRFAAREAIMKALGVGLGAFGFHDAWIERGVGGAPSIRTTGRASELLAARSVDSLWVSLSHTDLSAIAMVVATATGAHRDPTAASYAGDS